MLLQHCRHCFQQLRPACVGQPCLARPASEAQAAPRARLRFSAQIDVSGLGPSAAEDVHCANDMPYIGVLVRPTPCFSRNWTAGSLSLCRPDSSFTNASSGAADGCASVAAPLASRGAASVAAAGSVIRNCGSMLPNAKMRDRVPLGSSGGEARPCAKLAGAARTLHVSWSARSSQCHFALGAASILVRVAHRRGFQRAAIDPADFRHAVEQLCQHARMHCTNRTVRCSRVWGFQQESSKWMRLTESQFSVPASACRCSPSQQVFRVARPLAHAAHTQHRCVLFVLPAVRLTFLHVC